MRLRKHSDPTPDAREPKPDRRASLSDPAFQEAFAAIKGHDTTRLTRERLATLWRAAANVVAVPGAAAEIGSFQGGSAYFIAASFRGLLGEELPLEVIDTFEGHPQDKLSELDSPKQTEQIPFMDTSYEHVRDYLSAFARVTVHKGEFSRVAPTLPERAYRFVHVDTDLYEPTADCLRYFVPRLSPGGVIVLDDYGKSSCPGVEQATQEFLAGKSGFQLWDSHKQAVLVKNPSVGATPTAASS
ncbi:MAG TPA: TylF/MycF/NovP-related O-methyltransferase [Gaiellaceae bacterium]|nr:TylF/MycF/NovP-related O-methyltransferase [Gaiellaceae bacterium]